MYLVSGSRVAGVERVRDESDPCQLHDLPIGEVGDDMGPASFSGFVQQDELVYVFFNAGNSRSPFPYSSWSSAIGAHKPLRHSREECA
jgi:hypothetical protein